MICLFISTFQCFRLYTIIMEQLKDQHKLFQKLFISPTATTRTPHLILSMQFLKLLLEEAPQLAPAPLKLLLLKILGLFEIQPINSLLLYHHDWTTVGQTPLLTQIILACAKGVTSRQQGEEYLLLLDSLLAYYPVALLHITSITRQFSLQFHHGRFDALKSWFLHKILQKYYGPKKGLKMLPQSCFFFYGCTQVSTIHSFQDMRVKLKQQMGIVFSFFLIDKPMEDLVICRLKTNKESIVVKVGPRLTILNESTNQKIVEYQEIKAQKWARLVINLSPNETVVFLNDEIITKERPIIRKEKDRELVEYAFGEELVGFMTGIVLAYRVIPTEIVKHLPQLKNWQETTFVSKKNLEDIFLLCCFPFSTFDMRGLTHCFDIFQRIHSQIGQNIVVFKNVTEYAGFQSLGGPEILLPLFYLARFYNHTQYPDQLQSLLKIWLSSMTLFPQYDNVEQFLLVLSHHLEALPELLTPTCVNLLGLIYQKHTISNKTHFLRHIAWSGLPAKTNCLASAEWMHWLTKLYQNHKYICLEAYGLLDVVYWLVIHLEDSNHTCCPQHYLSEARVLRQFSIQEMSRIEVNNKRLHFEAVQNIAAVILEYSIIDQQNTTQRKLKGILRLLLHKYSSCLCRTILRIFKRQYPKFKNDKDLSLFFMEVDLIPFLAALAEKTVDAGLIALIIYLLLMVCNYKEGGKSLAIDYLAIVLRRMELIYQEHFNPVAHGVKKLRKKSLGSGESRGYTDLVGKLAAYKQDMKEVAIILLNFCCGEVVEQQIVKESRLIGQEPLSLLRYLMPIAGPKVRRLILNVLETKLEESPGNRGWCMQSSQFNEVLLLAVQQKGTDAVTAKKFMAKILQWMLPNTTKITEHYILLKTLTKAQIDLTALLSEVFLEIVVHNEQLSLDQLQIFMLVASAEFHQASPTDCPPYWKLMSLLATRICKLLYKALNIDCQHDPEGLLTKLRGLSAQILKIGLFGLQLNVIEEEDITFLFDICLPKAATGCNVESLFQEAKRRVYVFEIMVWSLVEISTAQNEHKLSVIQDLLCMIKIFLAVSLLKCELSIDKSFVRMVIFNVSQALCFSHLQEHFADLWLWILNLTKIQALHYKVESYQDLIIKLTDDKIQPYLAELFQTFLRSNNVEYLLPFPQLLDQTQHLLFIKNQLTNIMTLDSMNYAIQHCKQYAFNQLSLIFSGKVRITRERLDSQSKNNERELVKEVERLFEQQSVGEEQTRIRYLHEYECSLRSYFSTWKKIWKRLRIYHHPYGLFMAQKDSPNSFQFPSTTLKNFRFKISKFSSESSIQPILEAQVLEPWHVRKNIKRDAKHQLSTLVEMARPIHYPRKRESLGQMAANLFRTLRGDKKKQQSAEYDVIWIKRGRKARGRLLVSDNFELIFWYDSLKQEDSHLSFERFSLPYDKPMIKRWRIDLIKKISLRRYLMQWHALQLELIYNKSLLFYFFQEKQSHFISDIAAIRNARIGQFGQRLKLNKVPLYLDGWYSDDLQPKITEEWLSRKRSTLSYLMAVNQAASRSILDISQYPVIPWVCEMTEEKQPVMRNLAKSMGALGSEERKKIVQEKFISKDPFNPVPPFFFGTHYSSPGVVFNYLIRVAPFTDYCKNLQGGKFDIPDRLFASLQTAWKSASSEVSDVRQMIPQFYYLPELLLNLENLHFGYTQGGQEVSQVELPPWAGNNPYFLVTQLRQMLESDQVSGEISHWIDFIFGKGQKGQEAINNYNIYYYLTYEDYSNCLHNQQDEVYKKSCEAQIIHFGQIPAQLFDNPHPQRLPLPKPPTELAVIRVDLPNSLTDKPVGLLRNSHEVILIRRNQIQTYLTGKSPAVQTKAVDFNLERTITKKLFNLKKQCGRTLFFKKYFLVYGYVTHQFRIFNRSNGNLEHDDQLDSKIQCAILNEQESLLLIGCQSGLLHIYQLDYYQNSKLSLKKVFSLPFTHPVTHISYYDGFFSISFGCYVAIYKIQRPLSFLSKNPVQPFIRFFRSFQNALPVKGAFIADAPLYCLILYDNAHVRVYSINGQLIRSISLAAKGIQRMLDSELHSLFVIYEQGRLTLVSTPDLRSLSQIDIPGAIQVAQGAVVYKNRIQLIDCLN